MITKYTEYIKENVNDVSNLIKLVNNIIKKLNQDLNQEYFKKIYIIHNSNIVYIRDKFDEDILKISIYNNIIIDYRYGYNSIIKSQIVVNLSDENFEKIIYEKILIANLITIICRNLMINKIKIIEEHLNINKNLNYIISFLLYNDLNIFINILKNNLVPDYIYNEYKYLIDAENFDLI